MPVYDAMALWILLCCR